MKVKFLEDYKTYHRGMQYPLEQIGKELAEELEKEGLARIFPLVTVEHKKAPPLKQSKKGR
jgi:hypothetical protein